MFATINFIRKGWLPILTTILFGVAWQKDASLAMQALSSGLKILLSVAPMIVAVFGLVGLLEAWIDRDHVAKWLGREGGMKALIIASLCGVFLIGPAYIIFPLLQSVLKQGARWAVITIVLTAWAVKIQLIPIEAQFLGWDFSITRALLTIIVAIPLGLFVEWVMERTEGKG